MINKAKPMDEHICHELFNPKMMRLGGYKMAKIVHGSMKITKKDNLKAIAYLSDDGSIYDADKREGRQLKFIKQYAKAHGIAIVKIIRRNAMGPVIMNKHIQSIIESIKKGEANAIIVTEIAKISHNSIDSYTKVGLINEAGGTVISVMEGILKLPIRRR